MDPMVIASIVFTVSAFFVGLVLFLKPLTAISLQEKFYARINWSLKPISVEKEVKSTKLMGLLVILITLMLLSMMVFA